LKNIIAIVMGLTELYLPKPWLFLSFFLYMPRFPTLLLLLSSSLILNLDPNTPWMGLHPLFTIQLRLPLIVIPFNSFLSYEHWIEYIHHERNIS
jgi:hypothetical protein